jgi:hypothetical protein
LSGQVARSGIIYGVHQKPAGIKSPVTENSSMAVGITRGKRAQALVFGIYNRILVES